MTLKRIYEPVDASDGYRVLVDRLWPRGLSRAKAGIDLWLKEISPSDELRRWFRHEPTKWQEFLKRYENELKEKRDVVTRLKEIIKQKGRVTLLFSASDTKHNNAVALVKILKL